MRTDTQLFKILKFLYKSRDKKVTSKEISEATGSKQILPFIKRLSNHVSKTKIDGKAYYWINPSCWEYVRKTIERSENENAQRMG